MSNENKNESKSMAAEDKNLEAAALDAIREAPGSMAPRSVDVVGLCSRLRISIRRFAGVLHGLAEVLVYDDRQKAAVALLEDLQASAECDGPLALLAQTRDSITCLAALEDNQGRKLICREEYARALLELRNAYGELLKVSNPAELAQNA